MRFVALFIGAGACAALGLVGLLVYGFFTGERVRPAGAPGGRVGCVRPAAPAMTGWPTTCAAVTYDMADAHCGEPAYEAARGDLLWNPKGGDGHVLVAEVPCSYGRTHEQREAAGHKYADCGCGGWGSGPCPGTTLICECGKDNSWRDHHYYVLARLAPGSASEQDREP